jgi:hypothetical protein
MKADKQETIDELLQGLQRILKDLDRMLAEIESTMPAETKKEWVQ